MAQPFALQNPQPDTLLSSSRRPLADGEIKGVGLVREPHSSLGIGACPIAAMQGPQLPPHSLFWALGTGHRHPDLTLVTTNPSHLCPVQPAFMAASRSAANTRQLVVKQSFAKERERLKIKIRMPAPLKEFSFIGSSPLPPFQ